MCRRDQANKHQHHPVHLHPHNSIERPRIRRSAGPARPWDSSRTLGLQPSNRHPMEKLYAGFAAASSHHLQGGFVASHSTGQDSLVPIILMKFSVLLSSAFCTNKMTTKMSSKTDQSRQRLSTTLAPCSCIYPLPSAAPHLWSPAKPSASPFLHCFGPQTAVNTRKTVQSARAAAPTKERGPR